MNETVATADIFQHPHEHVAFTEQVRLARRDLHTELIRNPLRKLRIGRAAEDAQLPLRRLKRLRAGPVGNATRHCQDNFRLQ